MMPFRGKRILLLSLPLTISLYLTTLLFHRISSKLFLPNEQYIRNDPYNFSVIVPDVLGCNGSAVEIDKEKLDRIDTRRYTEGVFTHFFNRFASDAMSLHRSLPDLRHQDCKLKLYNLNHMPTASILICFHNEAWSVLLRTVHSIIDRSPPSLIQEIILIDDLSDADHLQQPLLDYISAHLRQVRLIRAEKRMGLIRAHNLAAEKACGQVLLFLDSHVEVTSGWLEPLLDRIRENPKVVAIPAIDAIDSDTMEFLARDPELAFWGFEFGSYLMFNKVHLTERRKALRKSHAAPIVSPAMLGGHLAIRKDFFESLGRYDPEFDVWGSENMELSFKAWMCGGSLEILPCSRIGHIYPLMRPLPVVMPYAHPYSASIPLSFIQNNIRLAETWMDEYKLYFYNEVIPWFPVSYNVNVTERRMIRVTLKCHSFAWYLANVFPEGFDPINVLASGQIRNEANNRCIGSIRASIQMQYCRASYSQKWYLSASNGLIRRDEICWQLTEDTYDLQATYCDIENEQLKFNYLPDGKIINTKQKICLEASNDGLIRGAACDSYNPRQRWDWKRGPAEYFRQGHNMKSSSCHSRFNKNPIFLILALRLSFLPACFKLR